MQPICKACRASAQPAPHSLCTQLPVRARSIGGVTRQMHGSPNKAPCSTQLISCSSSHQYPCPQLGTRVSVSAGQHVSASTSAASGSQLWQQHGTAVQNQQQAVPTAVATAAAARGVLPLAALSRMLLTSSNANVFKTLTQRRQPVSGPMGVLLFLATIIAASFAAIRSALMRRGKSCKTCRGFGLQRCRLCLGSGRVDWAAKLKHFDVCPLCMNRRFIVCAECGGHYHRTMFAHRRRQAGGAFEPDSSVDNSTNSAGGFGGDSGSYQGQGPIVLNMAAAGAAAGGVTVVTSGIGITSGRVNPVLSSMSD